MAGNNRLITDNPRRVPPTRHARSGYLMLELATATVLLGMMMIASLQAAGWMLQQRRAIDRRAVALQEAANLLDELNSVPWAELTAERAQACRMSTETAAILSRAEVDVKLDASTDDPPARRITVTLHWQDSPGEDGAVRLTAWTYRRAEASR